MAHSIDWLKFTYKIFQSLSFWRDENVFVKMLADFLVTDKEQMISSRVTDITRGHNLRNRLVWLVDDERVGFLVDNSCGCQTINDKVGKKYLQSKHLMWKRLLLLPFVLFISVR